MKIAALSGMVLAMSIHVKAQTEEGLLHDLWNKIEETYPGLASKESKINAAALNEYVTKGERLPQLKGQAQNTYGTYESTMGAFFPQAGLFNVNSSDNLSGTVFSPNTYASATIEWELFSFGEKQNKSKAAKSKTYKAHSEKDTYILTLKKDLFNRFFQLLYKESQWIWNSKNVERLHSVRGITASLASAGIKSQADSLLASSSYSQALGENEKIRGQKEAAMIKLLELTGDDRVSVQTVMPNFLEPKQILTEPSRQIDLNHPALQTMVEAEEYLKYSSKAHKAAALPSIHLMGGYAYRGTGIGREGTVSGRWKDGFSNTAKNILLGIGVTWNITDVYTKKQKGNSLKKDAESINFLNKQQELAMQSDLSATQNKITHQYVEVQQTKDAQEEAEKAYEMYLSRYKSGLMDLSTLLQVQQLLETAENKHIEAAFAYWTLLAGEAALTGDFDHLFNNF